MEINKKNFIFGSIILVFLFLVAELLGYLYISSSLGYSGFLVETPTHDWKNLNSKFWVDVDERFSVWHIPNASHRHKKACFDVEYRANSYGARDIERVKVSDKKRVIALGDSFTEGNGVAREDRLTNLLEKETGLEHLNFASSGGFGTTIHYLVYKHLASQFSHESVLINILPYNDFQDNDFEFGKKNIDYSQKYRPYFIGEYPNYELIYYPPDPDAIREQRGRKSIFWPIKRVLAEFTYSYPVARHFFWLMFFQSKGKYSKNQGDRIRESGYYTYTQQQFDLMKYTLEKLKEEAGDKKVMIVVIPRLQDLRLYDELGMPPLSKSLSELSKKIDARFLDLLPSMHAHDSHWEKYFLPCDGHWSPYGNQVASEYVRKKFY